MELVGAGGQLGPAFPQSAGRRRHGGPTEPPPPSHLTPRRSATEKECLSWKEERDINESDFFEMCIWEIRTDNHSLAVKILNV